MDGAQSESEKNPQAFSASDFMDRNKKIPLLPKDRLEQAFDWRVQSLSL